ncbi:DUF2992 family protein [Beduinella massiliensis]|uniref:DUF2992 family protein n=1 Tax=Beduinella massiliensis TaxID=1852363 RepID=UPI000C814789
MYIALTVFFEDPFWVGLVECGEGTRLCAARFVFGAEPSDAEVYAWVIAGMPGVRLSRTIAVKGAPMLAGNPKRRQRQARKLCAQEPGTKAQRALSAQRESDAAQRKEAQRERRELFAARRFALRQRQKREKHKGH